MAMSVMMLERPQGPLSVTLTKPRGLLSVHSKPGPRPWEGPVSTPRTNAARRHTQKQRARCQRAEPRCTRGPGVGGRGSGEWILRRRPQGPHTLLIVVDSATILGMTTCRALTASFWNYATTTISPISLRSHFTPVHVQPLLRAVKV